LILQNDQKVGLCNLSLYKLSFKPQSFKNAEQRATNWATLPSLILIKYLFVFQVPPDAIERAAGLLFFDKISRESLKKINGKPNKK
jgi:hypothetical protein